MHNTLMQENNVRGVYIPIEIKPGPWARLSSRYRGLGLRV